MMRHPGRHEEVPRLRPADQGHVPRSRTDAAPAPVHAVVGRRSVSGVVVREGGGADRVDGRQRRRGLRRHGVALPLQDRPGGQRVRADRSAIDQRHVHQQGPRPRGLPQVGLDHGGGAEPAAVQRARGGHRDRPVAQRSVRGPHRRQRADARDLRDHREDRADGDDGRDRRRDGHGQGGGRAGDPLAVAAVAQRSRRVRLRRGAAEPDRERAVRPREGQLHGRDDDTPRACSSRRTVARCSSTSSASCRSICSPSSCARSSSARSAAWARRRRQGRRPDHRRDQPQPRGGGARGAVPAGSVLPAQRGAAAPAVAEGSP